MQFLLTYAAIGLIFVAISCSKDETNKIENSEKQSLASTISNIEVVDEMLSFENDSAFEQGIIELSSLSTEERIKWETDRGFQSMKTLCENLSSEIDSIKTVEEYYRVRSVYDSFVTFGELNDDEQVFYIPLKKMYYLPAANIYGKVLIGGTVRNLKSDAVMNRILTENVILKGEGDDIDYCKKTGSKYQILCLIEETDNFNYTKLYISTQKKGLFGWNNNSTVRSWMYTGMTTNMIYNGDHLNVDNGVTNKTDDEKYTNITLLTVAGTSFKINVWGNGYSFDESCILERE